MHHHRDDVHNIHEDADGDAAALRDAVLPPPEDVEKEETGGVRGGAILVGQDDLHRWAIISIVHVVRLVRGSAGAARAGINDRQRKAACAERSGDRRRLEVLVRRRFFLCRIATRVRPQKTHPSLDGMDP